MDAKITSKTRREILDALRERYGNATKIEKSRS